MSKNIDYKIRFYSYWHCGSGLAAGASMDAIVVKDSDGLPFVPGKTIKGLVRENIEEYFKWKEETVSKMFGTRTEDADKKKMTSDKKEAEEDDKKTAPVQGESFFSNATLPESERQKIIQEKWQRFLYKSVASTAIDDKTQTAKEFSLRTTEVVVPCELQGQILNVDDSLAEEVKQAMRMIKRLGVDRNRGLGRCDFIIPKKEDKQ